MRTQETELRVAVKSSKKLLEYFRSNFKEKQSYSFIDHMYEPIGLEWDWSKCYFSLREWLYGKSTDKATEFKFVIKQYSEDVKSQKFGFKYPITSLEEGQEVLKLWHFHEILSFSRTGYHFLDENNDVAYFVEEIEHLGWTLEIECDQGHKQFLENLQKFTQEEYEVLKLSTPVLIKKLLKS